jgi:hypothetical protein
MGYDFPWHIDRYIDYQLIFHADAINQQYLVRLNYGVLYPTKSNRVILEVHSKVEKIPPPE